MGEVISNTSPIQYLYQAGLLDLLPKLFGRITIPEAVVDELAEGKRVGIELPDVTQLGWVTIGTVSAPSLLPLIRDLGPGERQVLALALERRGARVLLDDRLARRVALALDIPLTGTLGVLLRAKEEGHLETVGPILDRLDGLGFRLDPETRAVALRLANEDT